MDEISTGLDSAATFDICKSLKTVTQYLGTYNLFIKYNLMLKNMVWINFLTFFLLL